MSRPVEDSLFVRDEATRSAHVCVSKALEHFFAAQRALAHENWDSYEYNSAQVHWHLREATRWIEEALTHA